MVPVWINRNLTLLLLGRWLRSLVQSCLVILVPLYLAAIGFDAVRLGFLFTASAAFSALLAALTGVVADRAGRKVPLFALSLMAAAGSLAFALSPNFVVLVTAAALGSVGRGGGAGSGGAWGPYFPAEQALVAEQVSDRQRTAAFSLMSLVGVAGSALGALLAATPPMLQQLFALRPTAGYQLVFLLTALLGLMMALAVIPIEEERRRDERTTAKQETTPANPNPSGVPDEMSESPAASPAGDLPRAAAKADPLPGGEDAAGAARPTPQQPSRPASRFGLSYAGWRLASRFMLTSLTNGLAIGMLGPFVVYWFHRRYGVGPGQLGRLFFLIDLFSAVPYLLATRIVGRLGAVRTVVLARTVAVMLLAALPAMPSFVGAGILYAVRMVVNTVAIPVRQSYLMGVVAARERATVAGLASFPLQAGASVGPTMAGYLMQYFSLGLPLEIAALLQGANAALYYLFFHAVKPPEEIDDPTPAAADPAAPR